jgi:hypothetical protein
MTLRRARLSAALALVILALVAAPAALAQTQSLYWERYDVDLAVQADGTLRVEETQAINFTSGTFHEGFAELSTANTDGIDDVTLSEDGQEYEQRSSSCCLDPGEFAVEDTGSGTLQVIWNMGRTQDETRTFVLGYTVEGAIRRYAEGNEFQWNAIAPNMRDFDIRDSTITVQAPPGATLLLADYLIAPEFPAVPMTVDMAADGTSATWVAQQTIGPTEGVQIVVQLPPGSVGGSAPTWQAEFDRRNAWEQSYKPLVDLGLLVLGFLVLFGGPALLYLWWYLRGRDPKIDAIPEYITQPPADVPPGIAGTLIDERADVADVIATLMDLARRGYLVIEESSESSPVRLVSKEFTLKKVPDPPNLAALNPFERQLYDSVFRGPDTVRFSDLNQRFYTQMPGLQTKLYETAVQLGQFKSSPQSVRSSYGCLGTFLLVAVIGGGFLAVPLFSDMTSTLICPVLAATVVAGLLMWLGQHMPAKTRKGAEGAALSRAFRNYLANLEKYAKPEEVKDQFEKYLPYAIAFGLERTWINRFRKLPDVPIPGWYYPVGRPYLGRPGYPGTMGAGLPGSGGVGRGEAAPAGMPEMPTLQGMSDSLSGGLQSMSDGLNTMLNSAARIMTSTPPPSNTSGGGRSFSGGRVSSSSGRRSFSGGGFRSSGGGFRSSGGSGGGRRGFR